MRTETHLEPEVAIEIIDRIRLARLEAAATSLGDNHSPYGDPTLSVNPESMGEAYGMTTRGILRYMVKGRDHFVRKIEYKQRQWSPAFALAPAGVSLAAFDLYMFEIEQCLDDGQKIRACYQSPAMCRRHPCARLFSLTLLRKCFKKWSEEYHERDDRGEAIDRAASPVASLVKVPKWP